MTTHFDTTPLTSTYLIAFIVSDFEFVDNSATSKIRHRVFANPKDYQQGRFAVDEGEKILNAIAGYLHVPFSLPKMDQFAIPDFNAGGDFTFRFDKMNANFHHSMGKNDFFFKTVHTHLQPWRTGVWLHTERNYYFIIKAFICPCARQASQRLLLTSSVISGSVIWYRRNGGLTFG